MKYSIIAACVFVCVSPVFLWPLDDILHPSSSLSLAEEGFNLAANRIKRAAHPVTVSTSRPMTHKPPAKVHHERKHTTHHTQQHHTATTKKPSKPAHHPVIQHGHHNARSTLGHHHDNKNHQHHQQKKDSDPRKRLSEKPMTKSARKEDKHAKHSA